jgi:hypothetical protein
MVDSDGELKDARIPNLYDVKGNSEFYDQTHNGFAVHCRYDDMNKRTTEVTFKLLKAKFKENGSQNIGQSVVFEFDLFNQRYNDPLDGFDREPMFTPKKVEQLEVKEESSIDRSRVNAMNRQSGYNHFASDESLLDDCPF